ncbi:hypothetical protein GCM10027047_39280 [Rhodococcus aerolatus]
MSPGTRTAGRTGVAFVGERADVGRHLMVMVTVDPAAAAVVRESVAELLAGDGLWCGPAAAGPRCRTALLALVVSGVVSAEVVDAVGYDAAAEGRQACLARVAALADAAEVDLLVLARDDSCAKQDWAQSGELAYRVGASPALCCEHADVDVEPLTVLAELLVWSWTRGGDTRRAVANALTAVHLV